MSEPHVAHTKSLNITQNLTESRGRFASHTGVFRGARLSSLPTRDERRAPPKTPEWKASGRCTVTWQYLFLITVQSACDWILYWMPKRDLLISEAYAQLGAWDTSGCKFNGFIFLYVSKHATSLVTWYAEQTKQHCFECIFDLILKTVFNQFCEIGFK